MSTSGRGAVVVTGASSGIGEATSGTLARLGFDVFAGVRSDADAERLRSERVTPVRIDVTDEATIAAAAEQVAETLGGRGLAGLVNNAGIAVTAPMEYVPLDELRRQLEVNLVGQVAVTQAFLPALRAARGRIVNVSSIGGRVVVPLLGPYAASKFALEAVTDALRRELEPWGIEVSSVEPSTIATPIWEKGTTAADAILDGLPPEGEQRYGRLIASLRAIAARGTADGLPPQKVADVIVHALTARRPRTRYPVGTDAKFSVRFGALLPDRAFDRVIQLMIAAQARRAMR
jgi:NAD(P)-dependent dehydrogenase (short-subunit alcohol dehydrogenase family)